MSADPEVVSLVTCTAVTGDAEATLHRVHRAMSSMPNDVVVFVEFAYTREFSFCVEFRTPFGQVVIQSETELVLPRTSRRYDAVMVFPVRQLNLPPGSYNVVVVVEDSGQVAGSRLVFYGEM